MKPIHEMADFLEDFEDQFNHYCASYSFIVEDYVLREIQQFQGWVRDQIKKDLSCKRGPKEKSYLDWRNEYVEDNRD